MAESNKTTVIDFTENPKNAALFFDYVVPLHPKFFDEVVQTCIALPIPNIIDIFPMSISQDLEKYIDYWASFQQFVCSEPKETNSIPDVIPDREESWNELISLVESFVSSEAIMVYPEDMKIPNIYCDSCYKCSHIKLSQLKLIDTSQTEWEQIIQIREDEKAITKLRNLRLFFHQNYSDKEKSFVEDDLCKRYEDYKNTVKKWGFETITSSIQMLLTSPVTIASVGASLSMALFGEPLSALATAGTGVGLEIGKMSLHIAKQKKKLSVLQRDHPLAYIIDAKEKLEGK